jgi:flagellar hook protein FlgE
MDVIGNNIANVNTTGFKSTSVVFEDLLSQMVSGAGAPTEVSGGTNPAQVGLGVKIAGTSTNFAQGAAQLTGRATDLSISGDGFFVTRLGGEVLYTRAGAMSFDSSGQLVTPDGAKVQGWLGVDGAINTNGSQSDLSIPLGQVLPPTPTTKAGITGNLPADMTAAPVDTVITTSVTAYDSQGIEIPITFEFHKTDNDTWELQAYGTGDPPEAMWASPQQVTFDPTTGKMSSATTVTLAAADLNNGGYANAGPIDIDLANMTEFGSQKTITVDSQNGFAMGTLQSLSISVDGTITGVFSNGLTRPVGQIALATFTNPVGLEKAGGSSFRATVNSGLPNVGVAGNGRGTINSGTLEMSNVDLAQEFTNLIVAERGFQANSRVITTSDELLQDLVNIKR